MQAVLAGGGRDAKTAVVLVHGGALALEEGIKGTRAAILDAHYPGGETGAAAVADALFGRYNPGGKLRKTKTLTGAKLPSLPDTLEEQPTGGKPARWPLRPFSAHETKLLPGSRFHGAELCILPRGFGQGTYTHCSFLGWRP